MCTLESQRETGIAFQLAYTRFVYFGAGFLCREVRLNSRVNYDMAFGACYVRPRDFDVR